MEIQRVSGRLYDVAPEFAELLRRPERMSPYEQIGEAAE